MEQLNDRLNVTTRNEPRSLRRDGKPPIDAAELVEIKRANLELMAALKASRADATRLRKALEMNGQAVKISDQAYRDARLIAAALMAGEDVSQSAMRRIHRMSRRRWEWGRALMRLAGLTDGYYRLREWNPLTVERALLVARDNAADDLRRLKRYLPPSRWYELS